MITRKSKILKEYKVIFQLYASLVVPVRMFKSGQDKTHYTGVSDFYEGKSIFITGTAGYLGSVLLEILLTCIPGIKSIYILLREKKGVEPAARKKLIFQKKLFQKLLEEVPNVVDKVHVVEGDVSQPNLGMSEEDIAKVTKNASIVFHVAAIISFSKPLRFTALQNSMGTYNVIELCRKLQKLDALVFTSTAFSNANRTKIEENVYRLPFRAERYLEALKNEKSEEFEKLVSDYKPELPNFYTFSKCLAENIINDMASDLPIAIIRPSVVVSTWSGSLPCYIEEGTGLVDFGLAAGKGFIRVVCANENLRLDVIPADIVANAHIVAAMKVATKRLPTPYIVNCTGGPFIVHFGEHLKIFEKFCKDNMLPKSFLTPADAGIIQNKLLYKLYSYYEHYIPAYILDAILYLKGSKLRLCKLYCFYEASMEQMAVFLTKTFEFERNNYDALSEQLNERDKEKFYMDLNKVRTEDFLVGIKEANTFYDWKIDKKSKEERERVVHVRTIFVTAIKRTALFMICLMIYFIVSKLFKIMS